MEESNFTTVKRGRSSSNSDTDICKIKRSNTPDDIFSAILKDDILKDYELKDDDSTYDKTGCRHPSRRRAMSHGHRRAEGKMGHGMEDYSVATRKKVDDHELGLYAIFDGHCGRKAAEYLTDHLFDNILNEADFWTNPESAIKRAYESTDREILENVVGSRGGSTALTAILIDGARLVVANVGDSRAVVCRNGCGVQVSVDHEPLKERKMVEDKGGFVSQKPGDVPRVDGQLSMTRAFGDGRLKDHITVEPDIAMETIDEGVEFIILASDGLWKVMSNQDAVDCIRGSKEGGEAAEKLTKEALSRKSKDNISCVVIIFDN